MIAALSFLNATKNLWTLGVAVLLGGAIVVGIYTAGARAERNKVTAETMRLNTKIVSARAKDEAEIAAEDKAAKATDAAVSGAISQTCVITPETARLMASVR